ncbi:MAG: hypothetical protein U5N10_06235 [Gemmobacter sp.]|nr:hypothetical protein [Gemmobacter sp.]
MRIDMVNDAQEMLTTLGFKNIYTYNDESKNLGIGIHEMGTFVWVMTKNIPYSEQKQSSLGAETFLLLTVPQ